MAANIGNITPKSRADYLIKTKADGDERIVINATQFITPAVIADYVGRIAGAEGKLPLTGGTLTGLLTLLGGLALGTDGTTVTEDGGLLTVAAPLGAEFVQGLTVSGQPVLTAGSDLLAAIGDARLETKVSALGFGRAPVIVRATLDGDVIIPRCAEDGVEYDYLLTVPEADGESAAAWSVTAADGVKWAGGEAPPSDIAAGATLAVAAFCDLAVWEVFP